MKFTPWEGATITEIKVTGSDMLLRIEAEGVERALEISGMSMCGFSVLRIIEIVGIERKVLYEGSD